jgi:hypothetical protein
LLRLTLITLWNADTLEALEALGVDPKDTRGKENIELEDCFDFEVCVHVASLFEGFDGAHYLSMVAGAGFEPATFGL